MAHLKCVTHGSRIHLSDSVPGIVMHRNDLSRCDVDAIVTIGGNEYRPSVLIPNRSSYSNVLKFESQPDIPDYVPAGPKRKKAKR